MGWKFKEMGKSSCQSNNQRSPHKQRNIALTLAHAQTKLYTLNSAIIKKKTRNEKSHFSTDPRAPGRVRLRLYLSCWLRRGHPPGRGRWDAPSSRNRWAFISACGRCSFGGLVVRVCVPVSELFSLSVCPEYVWPLGGSKLCIT